MLYCFSAIYLSPRTRLFSHSFILGRTRRRATTPRSTLSTVTLPNCRASRFAMIPAIIKSLALWDRPNSWKEQPVTLVYIGWCISRLQNEPSNLNRCVSWLVLVTLGLYPALFIWSLIQVSSRTWTLFGQSPLWMICHMILRFLSTLWLSGPRLSIGNGDGHFHQQLEQMQTQESETWGKAFFECSQYSTWHGLKYICEPTPFSIRRLVGDYG